MDEVCYINNYFPKCRAMHGLTQYQNILSIFGGYHQDSTNDEYFNDFWEFDLDKL
jgi:hypothetical protein